MKDIQNYDDLPVTLSAEHIAEALGISRALAYQLLRRKDFPVVHIGKRMIVPRDAFIKWISDQTDA